MNFKQILMYHLYLLSMKIMNIYLGKGIKLRIHMNNANIMLNKIIAISPGGYKGIYMLGTCQYIKENYDLNNIVFTGASAGAWNALMMTCKDDIMKKHKKEIIDFSIEKSKNIFDTEHLLKKQIMNHYKTTDFELNRLHIGVTTFNGYKFINSVFTNFESLEDACNCCISSSHIPFITGGLLNIYKNYISFDGGFLHYPYIDNNYTLLYITPDIWHKNSKKINNIEEFTTLFSKKKYNFKDLYKEGYIDAKNNKKILDKLFKNMNKH